MKKIFLLLFVFISLSHAQESNRPQESKGTILSYKLNPGSLKTGEKGFVRIKLADDLISSDKRTISIKNNKWFHIDDIKINHEENEILVWFMPLDSSLSAFPDFKIEDRIYSGIPLSVKSALGNSSSINLPNGKLLLPWTKLLFAAGFTLLVLFLFSFYYVFKIVPQKIKKEVIFRSNAFKRKRLLKKMFKMNSLQEKSKKPDYIKRFIKLLKEYLEIAAAINTPPACAGVQVDYNMISEEFLLDGGRINPTCFTTKEIAAAFPGAPLKELVFFDSVRFGNAEANHQTISEASETIYNFALMIEETCGKEACGRKKI